MCLNGNCSMNVDQTASSPVELGLISSYLLITLATNTFVFVLTCRVPGPRLFSNTLIRSLVLSDLMTAILVMSIEVFRTMKFAFILQTPALSLIGHLFAYSQTSVSLYLILILSVQRLCLVTRPFKTSEKMNWYKWLLIGLAWILPFLVYAVFITVLISQDVAFFILENYSFSLLAGSSTVYASLVTKYALSFVAYLLPCMLIIVINVAIIVGLLAKSKRKNAYGANLSIKVKSPSNAAGHAQSREKKAITCLALIAFIMFFSQIFYLISTPLTQFGQFKNETLTKAFIWISYCNAFFDPIILLAFYEPVKSEFLKMLAALQGPKH